MIHSQQSHVQDFQLLESSKWKHFWTEAWALQGSITPHVLPNVILIGIVSTVICMASVLVERTLGVKLALPLAPYELIGVALGLLLVLRTNAGYDRWWEGRKLWGGIVNQSRNLAISALSYGPRDEKWRNEFVRLTAAFSHVARMSLRKETALKDLDGLVGADAAAQFLATRHLPNTIALELGKLLKEACELHGMDRFFFLAMDRDRTQLIDHIGACERIVKTPLALAYSIKIRRFIASFLLTLPFALIHALDNPFLVPLVTMLVAYPLFSLDQLGVELQNPFNVHHLSHLPLDQISATIEEDLLSLLEEEMLKNRPIELTASLGR